MLSTIVNIFLAIAAIALAFSLGQLLRAHWTVKKLEAERDELQERQNES